MGGPYPGAFGATTRAVRVGGVDTLARCSGGACNQGVLTELGQPCPDVDGNACTDAACDASGTCDQGFFVRNCTSPQVCDPATGLCQ
jgi:hypothetical protein